MNIIDSAGINGENPAKFPRSFDKIIFPPLNVAVKGTDIERQKFQECVL